MIRECLPKVGIKILKISYVKIIIPCFLTFCSSDQSLLSFLNFKFLNILLCYMVAAALINHLTVLVDYINIDLFLMIC